MGVSLDETAKRVRESRERAGLTPEDAASQSGMTPETWRQWEAGSDSPDFSEGMRAARVLGVNPTWLVTGEK